MIWLYAGFIAFVLLMLTLDLGVFHRKAHVVSVKEALGWSAVWITLGLSFAVFVYYGYEGQWLGLGVGVDAADGLVNDGWTATQKYLTGYIVEKSLSVDNIFVIALMFSFFAVPAIYQHRVLFWGILGALVMRGAMIAIGATLIAKFHWVLYIFGVFLILTAIKMLVMKTEHKDPNQNLLFGWCGGGFRSPPDSMASTSSCGPGHGPPMRANNPVWPPSRTRWWMGQARCCC